MCRFCSPLQRSGLTYLSTWNCLRGTALYIALGLTIIQPKPIFIWFWNFNLQDFIMFSGWTWKWWGNQDSWLQGETSKSHRWADLLLFPILPIYINLFSKTFNIQMSKQPIVQQWNTKTTKTEVVFKVFNVFKPRSSYELSSKREVLMNLYAEKLDSVLRKASKGFHKW